MLLEGIAQLFPDGETAEVWWQQMQCRLHTTACQLWHGEAEATGLLYGGPVVGAESPRQLTGVLPRLENRLARDWRPATVADLEGFLWSRLRFEYRTLLCLTVKPPIEPATPGRFDDEPAARPLDDDDLLDLRDSSVVAGMQQMLSENPVLLHTLNTLSAITGESDDAGEDCLAEGWRKRLLQRCAERLGIGQDTLHKRLERIRQVCQNA